jgi:hypothetical protein
MTNFLRHEACPTCGSRDNVGVWDDGHKWCFGGCGYYIPPTALSDAADVKLWLEKKKHDNARCPDLPRDCIFHLPTNVLNWLRLYNITEREQVLNRFSWSPSHERLIFPVYAAYGDLLMWQGRAFSTGVDGKKPRYFTAGQPEKIDHIIYKSATLLGSWAAQMREPRTIVVVEDIISTIVVSRVMPTLCLWGSSLSLARIKRLANCFERLLIWLDPDKTNTAIRTSIKARPYFDQVWVVNTVEDPKYYQAPQIQEYLDVYMED